MSFINLMGNDVWTDADIKARLHAEIRSEVTELTEIELNRALQGAMLGMHTLTQHERENIAHFKAATDRVDALGMSARADMILLSETMMVESARNRLSVTELTSDDIGYVLDALERSDALSVIANSSVNAIQLADLRSQHSQHN
jgi:hypothetical protein